MTSRRLTGILLAFAFLSTITLTPLAAGAETDCACAEKKKEEAPAWHHGLLFGYSLTSGNSKTNLLHLGLDSGYEDMEDVWTLGTKVNNGSSQAEQTQNEDTSEFYLAPFGRLSRRPYKDIIPPQKIINTRWERLKKLLIRAREAEC